MIIYPPTILLLFTFKFSLFLVLCHSATFDPYDQPPCTTTTSPGSGSGSGSAPAPAPEGSKWLPAFNSWPGSPPSPSFVGDSSSGLRVGFYVGKCLQDDVDVDVDVEAVIANVVEALFRDDPTLLPGLLRLQFHDCFVSGCDASILLEGNATEKTASPNRSVRGYKLVDVVKLAVEAKCPGVVSCADIIAVATKVLIKLGGGPDYPVETGRRDGLVSRAEDAHDLPSPFLSVDDTAAVFAAKNFTVSEMVALLGCHTVGVAHCVFFRDRLYPGTSLFDPFMDPDLRNHLISTCPQNTLVNSNFTLLDQDPRRLNTVDNSYFSQIINRRGVLPIDQEIARDPTTQGFVQQLSLNATLFNIEFANAMVKLQALDVLTGDQGEVRQVCRSVN